MLILVMGGAASGKSEYAENLCMNQAQGKKKLYIATMQPYGEEAKLRIERHHNLRAEKGFYTIEKYTKLYEIQNQTYETVLLECMSTLLANEYFCEELTAENGKEMEEKSIASIMKGVKRLKNSSETLVVVSNQIFSDGVDYGKESMEYMHALGKLNQLLGREADEVIQVVCGIPVVRKERGNI